MKKLWMGWLLVGMALGASEQVPEEIETEARAALARGAEWLAAQQQPGGYWGLPDSPAMSALAMGALQKVDAVTYANAINRAMVYILTSVQEDGSIWRTPTMQRKGGGLANYNTAICMAALHALGRPELVPVVQNARTYLAHMQYLGPGSYRGGMGYDADQDREYADLSNRDRKSVV